MGYPYLLGLTVTLMNLHMLLGFCLFNDLREYIDIPFLHDCQSIKVYNHLIEKAYRCLASWKTKFLSFVGRITLTQLGWGLVKDPYDLWVKILHNISAKWALSLRLRLGLTLQILDRAYPPPHII
ncbi:hypothetical protein CR513_18253, partial [Mucuna pruriens]